jgi:hypothetical protein
MVNLPKAGTQKPCVTRQQSRVALEERYSDDDVRAEFDDAVGR